MNISFENITKFINESELDDQTVLNELFEFLYSKIKSIANSQLNKLNPNNSVSPTQLVNECYIKLVSNKSLTIENRLHFYSLSARCMRFFLVDLLKQTLAQKNQGIIADVSISQVISEDGVELKLLELDMVLEDLFKINEELGTLTELKLFGGFTFEEISKILGQPMSTIYKKWMMAKSYLINLLES